MNDNLVRVRIHGVLGKEIGQKEWPLEVSSVNEALHAINCLTSSKLFYSMNSLSSKGVRYVVKVNDKIVGYFLSLSPFIYITIYCNNNTDYTRTFIMF